MGDYSEPVQSVDNELRLDEEEINRHFERKDQKFDDTEPSGNGSSEENAVRDSNSPQGLASRKLFVGGIAWSSTLESFTSYFRKYGQVVDSVIIADKFSGRSRGFGFVTFADPAVADTVLGREHILDGKTVEVKRAIPKAETEDQRKIFVRGLLPSLTNDNLLEYFSNFGNITSHQVMLDRTTGRSKGFGFVTFENEDAVKKVLMHSEKHVVEGKEVDIRRAEPRKAGLDNGLQSAYDKNDGSGAYGNFCGSYTGFYSGYGTYPYGFGYGGPVNMVLLDNLWQPLCPVWLP